MNKNAPYIREIVERTRQIQGELVQGKTKDETKQNVLLILQRQQTQNRNARTKTY